MSLSIRIFGPSDHFWKGFKPSDVWLAGLLEGEGSFHRRADTGRVVVRLFMTDEDVVRRAAALMGATVSLQKRSGNQKDGWQVWIGGEKAKDVMRRIRPYMGERRGTKIDELLSGGYLVDPHQGKLAV